MSDISKLFSRFIGKTLIFISTLIFITSLVIIALANNIEVLKSSLSSDELLEEAIGATLEQEPKLTLEERREGCNKNSEEEYCELIKDPSLLFGDSFNTISKGIEDNKSIISIFRILSILVFIIGVILLYFGTFNKYEAIYKAASTLFFSTIPYLIILYFSSSLTSSEFIVSLASNLFEQQIPNNILKILVDSVRVWLEASIQEIKPILIMLALVSLPLAIASYILKKKKETKKQS